jgi:hypothetical protein
MSSRGQIPEAEFAIRGIGELAEDIGEISGILKIEIMLWRSRNRRGSGDSERTDPRRGADQRLDQTSAIESVAL